MPKVNILKDREAEGNRLISGTIKKYIHAKHLTVKSTSLQVCIPEQTLYKRIQCPDTLRIKDIRKIAKKLDIPPIELVEGIFI